MQNYDDRAIYCFESGQVRSVYYYLKKVRHRLDGPAKLEYYESGQIKTESYWVNNNLHRTNGPAFIEYSISGQISVEDYFVNHQRHRIDGPSVIKYDTFGNIEHEFYFLNDRMVYVHDFVKMMRASKDKTQTLAKILTTEKELKNILLKILPNMFRKEIDSNVFNNLTMFF